MAGSAREEAERLVATVLARAVAGQAFSDRRWATGDPECCVCPVCKAIAAMRDPNPETAARLAGSASDLAGSVAGLLRSVSAIVGEKPKPAPSAPVAEPGNADQTWSAATRAGSNTADSAWAAAVNAAPAEAPSGDPWSAATDAEGTAGAETGTLSADESDLSDEEGAAVSREAASGEAGSGRVGSEVFGDVVRDDPWAAATTTSAAAVAERHAAEVAGRRAAELAERRAAALRAAAEAERRVAEAVELAKARRAAEAVGDVAATGGAQRAGGTRRLDVWAAATADAGVADSGPGDRVDHDAVVSGDEAGSAAQDDAEQRDN
ncbi:hypothetical protein [Paractinoplanes brasiliensis]|uniref:Uncharacterized protein n=1 Tax=Paractinoplanes brasiliensis TaxID=52695 RepID=A0A4R6JNJ0_9ACTN|nr:hypothetical protein [Actinoplanes brasiliensis]TDO37769.1 hypothetical protein C8E87_1403 [Actinoplanes brasiliensis]GID32109.1 hypothetical protein Abr02nite_70920 [Actinoplanes brasiliensis]